MDLWRLLRRDALRNVQSLFLLAVFAAALNLSVLTTLNDALLHLEDGHGLERLLLIFLVSAVVWRMAQNLLMRMASKRIQAGLGRLRVDLLRRALAADLPDVMALGPNRIAQAAGAELQILAQAVPTLVISVQSVAAIILCLLYLSSLSGLAVLIVITSLGLGGIIVARIVAKLEVQAESIHESEVGLTERADHILKTLRECKVNRRRRANALADIDACTGELHRKRFQFNVLYADYYMANELAYYFSIAGIIFLLPAMAATEISTVVLSAHAAAFVAYPVITIVTSYPSYLGAETAARSYLAIEEELKTPAAPAKPVAGPAAGPAVDFTGFSTLALEGMTFRHAGREGIGSFSVGPIDLTVERGTITFVTGHNGSGKSTLIHMLLGLYPAHRGALTVDGQPVTADAMASYRDLFSVVFSDVHLTRQLYGARDLEDGFAEELFDLLEIADKVALDGDAFTTVELSQGQKKRLALVAALLERKPVLVLDEWAADQSPYFRRKFYREIIPWLKARGITVIAVTHDDAYFDAADVQIQVERGSAQRLVPARPAPESLPAV